jgi:hypothetical protein
MADRYWIGGSGSWTDTAKWSTSSGGSGGASVPTSTDNVFFDANSHTGANISVSNYNFAQVNDSTISGVGYSVVFDTGGTFPGNRWLGNVQWDDPVGFNTSNDTPFYFIAAAGKTNTINIAYAVTFKDAIFDGGAGATIDINAPLGIRARSDPGSIYFSGTATTTINWNSSLFFFESNFSVGANITLNAGSATVKQKGYRFNSGQGLTINAACNWVSGTETFLVEEGGLTFSSAIGQGTLNANGKTFYQIKMNKANLCRITSPVTLVNGIEINAQAVSTLSQIQVEMAADNIVINGPITISNTEPGVRWVKFDTGSASGVKRTVTINSASTTLVDTYFQNLRIQGTAAPLSGTRIGKLENVDGVTFTAPKTVYRIGTGNWNAVQWSNTSGGSPSNIYYPLPQDTAVYDENTTAGTQNINSVYTSAIDASARTTALTLTFSSTAIYGDLTLGSGITAGGSGTLTFSGNNDLDLDSAGKTLPLSITTNLFGGTLTLTSALTITGGITITSGTFDTDSYALTATALNTSGTLPRSFIAGSSTISMAGAPSINFTGAINFTSDFGTSTLNIDRPSISTNFNFFGAGQTFYNVNFISTDQTECTITGDNTFNTIAITASTYNSSRAQQRIFFGGNQTIGTLSSSGTAGNNRIFLLSNTAGTPRTLNIGSLTASDVDFRDIAVTGSAAGSTPTRAGDCGGNSGIVFPAPKTVYWNLAGTQNWDDNGWAATSGGSPSTDYFPLAQDTAVFDNTGAAGTVTLGGGAANVGKQPIGNVDMSARTTAMTLGTSNGFLQCYGNWTWGTGVTSTVSVAGISFSKRGTQTFTSNGVTTGFPLSVGSGVSNAPESTIFVLGDAFAGQSMSLFQGTMDANNYNVTINNFDTSTGIAAFVRVVKGGTGLWTLTGTGTVWHSGGIFDSSNILCHNTEFLLSNNTSTARTFLTRGAAYKKITIGGTSSTSTTTFSTGSASSDTVYIGELASTKTVAHTIAFNNNSTYHIGVWSVTGTSGNVVTVNRASGGVWNLLLYRRTSGIDYLNVINCTVSTLSPAEFYVGANSTDGGGNTRAVFTATPSPRTLYWVGGTGNWSDSARWSLSSGGGGGEAQPTSFDDVVFDSSSNATGYTMTIDSSLGARCQKLTINGPATGNITWAGSQPMYIHDDISLAGGANITRTFTGALNLNGYTAGHTFDSNGVTFASTLNVSTFTGEWAFSSAYTNTGSIVVLLGSIDFDTYNVTAGAISATTGYTKKIIDFGSGTITLSGGTPIDFGSNILTSDPLSTVAGTSTISITSSGNITFNGNGKSFYNLTYATASSSRSDSINGQNQNTYQAGNTFNDLTYRTINGDGVNTLNINNNTTIGGTLTASGASGIRRTVLQSGTLGTQRTITLNALAGSSQDINFRDISIAGTASPISGTRFGDMGGNSGITMSAAKNVYRLGTGNWLTNNWAPSSGGSANTDNFPLPQDTAIFDESTTAGTHNINYTTAISSIDASARTSALTLSFNGANTVYGGIVLGSGITVSGTSAQTFSFQGNQFLDSAGKTVTFPMTITSINGNVQLSGAWTSSNTITLNSGTLSLSSYTLTCTVFTSTTSTARTVNFGSGVFNLTSTGTMWNVSTSTNFSVIKGSGEIFCSSTVASNRTFTGSAANITIAYPKLTIGGTTTTSNFILSGNNYFTELASTKTVAHAIYPQNTTTTVDAFTITGTSGNVVNFIGTSLGDPGVFVIKSTLPIQNLDYLRFTSMRLFPYNDVWYVGANSTSVSEIGAIFAVAPAPPVPVSAGEMFLLFM